MFHPYKKGSGGQQSLLSGKSGQAGKTKKNEGPAGNSGAGSDYNLVAPIRQTASIFKQPVTVYKEHKSKVGLLLIKPIGQTCHLITAGEARAEARLSREAPPVILDPQTVLSQHGQRV